MKKFYGLFLSIISIIFTDYLLSKTELPVDSDGYLLGFEKFAKKAKDTQGEKRIILVGGSSLGMGVSGKTLTNNLGVTTINSGIHAGVGYTNFMRIIKKYIDKENDLLVFSPEYDTNFRVPIFPRSKEFCEISLYIKKTYTFDCIGYSLSRLFLIRSHLQLNNGDYRRDGFNDYGDYIYRQKKAMKNSFDDPCTGVNIEDLKTKYIPYLKNLQSKNYKLVYVPNFIPSSACSKKDEVKKFHQNIASNFGVQNIDNVQLFFEDKYFYDSSYHLNEEGVKIKTRIFEENLKKYLLN